METGKIRSFVEAAWDDSIIPSLAEYITIPALSPGFDPDWEKNGHLDRAMEHVAAWCREHGPDDMTTEIVRLPGRTPLLLMEVPGQVDDTVMLYGHVDKQPAFTGWREDLGPWKPVLEDGKLYGRGGADDGYAAYASVAAIRALREQGVPHARCVILIEATEESGSPDLPAYLEHLADRVDVPSLIVCLDSGAGNYDQLWMTASLRGMFAGTLTVEVLKQGVHSGSASGIVASSFRIARTLLSRVEDENTGRVLLDDLHVDIPPDRLEQAAAVAEVLGNAVVNDFPFVAGMRPVTEDLREIVLNGTWRPTLSVVGADGFPPLAEAGNVLRTHSSLKLSFRLPPGVDSEAAAALAKEVLEKDPPYGAKVTFELEGTGDGWAAPTLAPWLERSLEEASQTFFGRPPCFMGEGGSIPFMALLGEKFPEAQFLITGVLGPESNAHGPNEFLHVGATKKVTSCVARVLADHGTAFSK